MSLNVHVTVTKQSARTAFHNHILRSLLKRLKKKGDGYLGPVIAGSVGEEISGRIDGASGDGKIKLFRSLELGAGILVPKAELAVRAAGGESSVRRVESDAVHLRMYRNNISKLFTNNGK